MMLAIGIISMIGIVPVAYLLHTCTSTMSVLLSIAGYTAGIIHGYR